MVNKKVIKIILSVFCFIYLIFSNSYAYGVKTMIKVAFDPNLPPYQFLEDGKPAGIHIDILNNIAQKNNLIIEYAPMNVTTDAMDALENGEVDIVLGVLMDNYRYRNVEFTEGISQSSLIMIALNENARNVKNKINSEYMTATFQSGIIGHFFIQNMRYLRCIILSNNIRAFEMLDNGEVDVMIGEKNSLLYQINKSNTEDLYTITNSYVVPIEYSIAVRPADENLKRKLNTNIYQMRVNGDYETIYNKWIQEDDFGKREIIRKVTKFVIISVIGFISILVFNLRHSHLLKRQVDEKTKELQNLNFDLQNQIIETLNNNEVKNRITEDNPNSIIVFNLDYIITLFNPSASKLTNMPDSPIGKSVFDIDLLSRILSAKRDKLFREGAQFTYEDINIINGDGDDLTYRYVIYQLFDVQKRIRGAILSIEDVTKERKEREEIMEKEKNKALNHIIAGVAHEIRNPLMAIKTFVELIPVKRESQQFQDLMAQYVPEELDRIDSLVKGLIDYAKPEVNNKEILDIKDIINSCAMLISASIGKKDISLDIEVEDDLLIMADKNQLKQILVNVILNGLESMSEKDKSVYEPQRNLRMTINAWEEGNFVFIQVYDEGVGMDDTEIKRSMEPFFTTKGKGTGLGLPMTRHYVEENGGTMTIKSKKNEFTNITLKFRRYRDE